MQLKMFSSSKPKFKKYVNRIGKANWAFPILCTESFPVSENKLWKQQKSAFSYLWDLTLAVCAKHPMDQTLFKLLFSYCTKAWPHNQIWFPSYFRSWADPEHHLGRRNLKISSSSDQLFLSFLLIRPKILGKISFFHNLISILRGKILPPPLRICHYFQW